MGRTSHTGRNCLPTSAMIMSGGRIRFADLWIFIRFSVKKFTLNFVNTSFQVLKAWIIVYNYKSSRFIGSEEFFSYAVWTHDTATPSVCDDKMCEIRYPLFNIIEVKSVLVHTFDISSDTSGGSVSNIGDEERPEASLDSSNSSWVKERLKISSCSLWNVKMYLKWYVPIAFSFSRAQPDLVSNKSPYFSHITPKFWLQIHYMLAFIAENVPISIF